MASFADLSANLNLNINNFAGNLRSATKLARKFSSNLAGKINSGLVVPGKKAKVQYKDVARIVQGILISKVFYTGLNMIRRSTAEVWEFSKALEYARISYANLFQDAGLADRLIVVLKEFAAVTPFSFQESEAAAKRLLAYGIQAKNVMYVMQGVLAASAMQGNPQVIESISRSLGQIYTKGRLMNEEMRQLAESGIPAYEILKDKLGLTQKQLQNLGREAIPASIAINALVDGINERFGGVISASVMTTTGIISNIKDNATMLFSEISRNGQERIKGFLAKVGDWLFDLRDIATKSGIGGVFEALIPEDLRMPLKEVIADVMTFYQVVKRVFKSIGPAAKAAFKSFLEVAHVLLSVLNLVGLGLEDVGKKISGVQSLTKTLTTVLLIAAGAWAIFKIQALAAAAIQGLVGIIMGVSKAIMFLGAVLMSSPVMFGLLAITGVIAAIGLTSRNSNASFSKFIENLKQLGGVNPNQLFNPEDNDVTGDINDFNEALDTTNDTLNNIEDSANGVAKALKGLLSFDEVFKLNQSGGAGGADLGSVFDIGDLGGLGGGFEGIIPEVPDLTEYATTFVNNLKEKLGNKLLTAGIGGIIGGALGFILGGPVGLKVGAILGTFAGWFWSTLADKLGLSDTEALSVEIGTGIGAAIGAVIGGPAGALIGAAIGGLLGDLIALIIEGFKTGNWDIGGIAFSAGTLIGAAIGLIAGGPAGALIGAAIGALIGWIVDQFTDGFKNGEWDVGNMALAIGTLIGGVIGLVIGGPAGALIGAAVGALVGWIIGEISDGFKKKQGVNTGKSYQGDTGGGTRSALNPGLVVKPGYATGGIITREHVAVVGEGGKREAIIPLENGGAMAPFSQAVSNDVISTLAPLLASGGGSSERPLNVGTLIADDSGIRMLYKMLKQIEEEEKARRGENV